MADILPLNTPTEATNLLPSQFIDQPNIAALWRGLAYPIQDYEDTLFWLQTAYSLDNADGVQLDYVGQILNQPRLGGPYPVGESDSDYRVKLRAAVLRNRSNGSTPDLIAVVKALLNGNAVKVQIIDTPPAAFVLLVQVTTPLTSGEQTALIEFCESARSAGVGIAGLAWYADPTFAFDGFPDPPFQGYDDGTGAVGGYWANYIWP